MIPRKEPDMLIEYSPIEYRPNPRGRDLVHSKIELKRKRESAYILFH